MITLVLESPRVFDDDVQVLQEKLDLNVKKYQNEKTFFNTEASLVNIIRGEINYFWNLSKDFLGTNNSADIPSMEADNFANNIYRTINSVYTLAKLWGVEICKNKELEILEDIRTLIVHSGEQLTNLEQLGLNGFKDTQLGRIFYKEKDRILHFNDEHDKADYCIQIWSDKHERSKKDHLAEVDYHLKKESFSEGNIYLSFFDVKNIMLCYISDFLCAGSDGKLNEELKLLPDIKNKFIDQNQDIIEFKKIANLISKNMRGGLFKENNIVYWDGFGLKRLYEYSKKYIDNSDEIYRFINERIFIAISNFWDSYQNENMLDDDLPSLDIMDVFKDCRIGIKEKSYIESEKLFNNIAPYFNTSDSREVGDTDVIYLKKFIEYVKKVLKTNLDVKKPVNDIVCEYFIQLIANKLKENKK